MQNEDNHVIEKSIPILLFKYREIAEEEWP